jgi:hypothetical protein
MTSLITVIVIAALVVFVYKMFQKKQEKDIHTASRIQQKKLRDHKVLTHIRQCDEYYDLIIMKKVIPDWFQFEITWETTGTCEHKLNNLPGVERASREKYQYDIHTGLAFNEHDIIRQAKEIILLEHQEELDLSAIEDELSLPPPKQRLNLHT